MSVIGFSILLSVIALMFIIVGYFLLDSDNKGMSAIAVILILVGIAIGIYANVNVYFYGSEKDIITWLFWFRG